MRDMDRIPQSTIRATDTGNDNRETLVPYSVVVRVLYTALGLVGIAWGLVTLPSSWQSAPIERAAGLLMQQHPIRGAALETLLAETKSAKLGSLCRPTLARSEAVIQIRLLEEALDLEQRTKIDALLQNVDRALRTALSCSPSDPFLWFVLYWLESFSGVISEKSITYLALSYDLGPNEGWIALKRNRAAFAIFEKLPPNFADRVIAEFIGLIATNRLYTEAAQIFVGPAWRVRDRIIPRLAELGQLQRIGFAKTLYHRGYEIDIPGVPHFDYRRRHK